VAKLVQQRLDDLFLTRHDVSIRVESGAALFDSLLLELVGQQLNQELPFLNVN
jgi:hypothetical protein